jgi:hypothetical protein
LSHRYGQRVLPSEIGVEVFESIKNECSNLDLSFECEIENKKISIHNLLEHCYVLDENEVPKKYKFLEATAIFQGFEHKVIFPEFNWNFFF